MGESKREIEIDVLLGTLKNSSLPTVLVEGKDDMVFYRRLEEDLCDLGVDILPAGNKDKVLEIRKKIVSEGGLSIPIAFIVDKDLWVNFGVPPEYQDEVITTNGYSIENDMFFDGELLTLLDKDEEKTFKIELEKFIRWYALAIDRNINSRCVVENNEYSYRNNPHQVLDENFLSKELTLIREEIYPEQLYVSILNEYGMKLRGKSLFQLLTRQLSGSHRKANKFGVYQLIEIGAARKGNNYQRLLDILRSKFN